MESTDIHRTLGKGRIKQICENYGLTVEDEKIIDEILLWWKHLPGKPNERIEVALEIIKDNPRYKQIIKALLIICFEFAKIKRQKGGKK